MRYADDLDVHWELEERIFGYKTLKFVLQPLVENAIEHGIASMNKKNIITIRGYIKKEMLIFEVKDNGIGMTKERLDLLRKQIAGEVESDRVGVKNINERIKIYCGADYGIEIESERDVETCFRVNLKLMK